MGKTTFDQRIQFCKKVREAENIDMLSSPYYHYEWQVNFPWFFAKRRQPTIEFYKIIFRMGDSEPDGRWKWNELTIKQQLILLSYLNNEDRKRLEKWFSPALNILTL